MASTPCQVCGEPLPEGASFCPNCGSPVGTPLGTEERKVVTVLFAAAFEGAALPGSGSQLDRCASLLDRSEELAVG